MKYRRNTNIISCNRLKEMQSKFYKKVNKSPSLHTGRYLRPNSSTIRPVNLRNLLKGLDRGI
jgi:hypothetical protein